MTGTQTAIEQREKTFIEKMARRLGGAANAKYIYAEPVERDGVTVIPVARAVYGFGGGSGKKAGEAGEGGGGGVALTPVGYIEIKRGASRFRPTRDLLMLVPLILASAAPVVWLTARALKKFTKNKSESPELQ